MRNCVNLCTFFFDLIILLYWLLPLEIHPLKNRRKINQIWAAPDRMQVLLWSSCSSDVFAAKMISFLVKHSSAADGDDTRSTLRLPSRRNRMSPYFSGIWWRMRWTGLASKWRWPINAVDWLSGQMEMAYKRKCGGALVGAFLGLHAVLRRALRPEEWRRKQWPS